MTLLQLKDICKSYRLNEHQSYQALKHINVSFEKGELVSIIGESGSGKSTMMNLIGGLDTHFEGELFVEGKDIAKLTKEQLDEYRKHKIGFIFQSCHLIPHLSILDNVTIALTLSHVKKEERIKKAEAALKQVGLEAHLHKKPNQLSGGQRQRVAIARALINEPEIILADEPTGALDSETTEQVLAIIKKIASEGKLVIMVTHSEKVAAHSSRIIKISDGEIIEDQAGPQHQVVHEGVEEEEKVAARVQDAKRDLSLMSAVKLAGNNMKQKLKRNILVALGVSIGIMGVITMLALGNGLKAYFSTMIDSFMNPLVVEVSMGSEEIDPTDPSAQMMAMMGMKPVFQPENLEELSQLEGVKAVEKGFQFLAMPGSNYVTDGENKSYLMGILSMSSVQTSDNVSDGELPKLGEILVNQSVAEELGGDLIGKSITLKAVVDEEMVEGTFIVSGIYTAGENNSMADNSNAVYMHYEDMEALLAAEGKTLEPNIAYLVADHEEAASKIKTEITTLGYGGSTQEMMGDQMLTMLNILTVVLSGIAGISLVVSSIMILVVLFISVVERTKEIGLLRAIGARSKDIRRIFVSEALLIGMVSGGIGILGAVGISLVVNQVSVQLFEMQVMNVTVGYALSGMAISTIVSMLAGLFPANKAAKLDPIDSLRTE